MAIALPCFILLVISPRLPLGHIDSLVYDDILDVIGLAFLTAGALGVVGLFHRRSRVLAIAAIGLSLAGLILIPGMIAA